MKALDEFEADGIAMDTTSEEDGELCAPCKGVEKKTTAEKYCTECSESLCSDCSQIIYSFTGSLKATWFSILMNRTKRTLERQPFLQTISRALNIPKGLFPAFVENTMHYNA